MNEPALGTVTFHAVSEAADPLHVDPVTIYRAIRDNAFPAAKIRGRSVVPARALKKLAQEAIASLACVDVADYVLHRRLSGSERDGS